MTGALFGVTALEVDTGSFLAIVATAAIAGTLSAVAGARNVFVPVVVVELVLGVVIGPQVLDLAQVNDFTEFFADPRARHAVLLRRLRDRHRAASAGQPLRLALAGWALSLVIAYTLGGVLAAARRRRLARLRRAPRWRRPRSAR